MNVTFLIPNRTINPDWIAEILGHSATDSYKKLTSVALNNCLGITCKIGNGSFRDRVECNQAMRTAVIPVPIVAKRKGYQLISYEIKP